MSPDDIKEVRKKLACTAKELAGALGIEQATVLAWEKATLFPTKIYVDRMAELLAKGPSAIPRKAIKPKAQVGDGTSPATPERGRNDGLTSPRLTTPPSAGVPSELTTPPSADVPSELTTPPSADVPSELTTPPSADVPSATPERRHVPGSAGAWSTPDGRNDGGSDPLRVLADPQVWELVRKIAANKKFRDEVAKLAERYPDPATE